MRFRLMIFVLTLAAGIGFGGSEKISEKVSHYLHHDCVRWDEQTLARPLFTLKEVHPLLGRKVHLKNSKFYPDNVGQTRMMQMVGQDKFFLMVDWKIDPEQGKEALSFYDKDVLPNLIFED